MADINQRWGVYYKTDEDAYYISTFMHSPVGAKELDTFWASDRKEALTKGDAIVDDYRKVASKKG